MSRSCKTICLKRTMAMTLVLNAGLEAWEVVMRIREVTQTVETEVKIEDPCSHAMVRKS